jgi:hypothetical protein
MRTFLQVNLQGREHLKDAGVWEDHIRMKLNETTWGCGLDSSDSGWRKMTGFCEDRNEPLIFIKSLIPRLPERLSIFEEGLCSVD